jgi:hypothetical protein
VRDYIFIPAKRCGRLCVFMISASDRRILNHTSREQNRKSVPQRIEPRQAQCANSRLNSIVNKAKGKSRTNIKVKNAGILRSTQLAKTYTTDSS